MPPVFEMVETGGPGRRRRMLFAAGEALAVAAVLVLFALPCEPSRIPFFGCYQCPFNWLTGLDCPGCGMTRAMFFLAHGRLSEAAACNPWVFVLAGFLLYRLFQRLAELLFGRYPAARCSGAMFWLLPLSLLVFGGGRLALQLARASGIV